MFEQNLFDGEPDFEHGEIPAVGILLAILGTPEAPTEEALRPYLRQFLSDRRVIEIWPPAWKLILEAFILPSRPAKSAEAYASMWAEDGSPLLLISKEQQAGLARRLGERLGTPIHFALGSTYGEPSMAAGLEALRDKGCRRILFVSMFPQYSSTSTGAAFDAGMRALMRWRWLPELRTLTRWHDKPGYIDALANSVRELWDAEGEPEKLVMSFHGVPQRYLEDGDPYHCQCLKTGRLLAERLGLPRDRWVVCFQSLFGREEWIKPYTDETLKAMAKAGIKKVDVICPGFSADCLETLEEIEEENREYFLHGGGEQFRYIPALNARDDHLDFLADLIEQNLGEWVADRDGYDVAGATREAAVSKQQADALLACPAHADGGYGALAAKQAAEQAEHQKAKGSAGRVAVLVGLIVAGLIALVVGARDDRDQE
ncbi:MAG: ferrochelatase [Acidobacteriota bacterium]